MLLGPTDCSRHTTVLWDGCLGDGGGRGGREALTQTGKVGAGFQEEEFVLGWGSDSNQRLMVDLSYGSEVVGCPGLTGLYMSYVGEVSGFQTRWESV